MSLLTKILGDPNEKVLKQMRPMVEETNQLEKKFKSFDDEKLKKAMQKHLAEVRKEIIWESQKQLLDKKLPEVFAIAREAARRKLGQRHYDVQLLGGIVLHRGQISEMRTGEGKTLTASLPVCLNALAGRGAHVITPNDYLSRVGGGWMGPVYYALGLSLGVITHDFSGVYDPNYTSPEAHGGDERLRHWRPVERREAYACDITYGTNNEFGFDYLRDNMAPDIKYVVQRDLHYAIVDEIDSILIDEARTPLIISAPAEESTDKYRQFFQLVTQLKENEDYNVDEKMRAATLTENGLTRMEKLLGVKNIYTEGGIREVHHIEQALKAHTLFKRDRDYVVKDGEIIIVDEFTGRLMPGRRYSEGLHQAIEAREGVEVKRESMTVATITFQNYFRMYTKLSGMTGTAKTEEEEFGKIYGLATVVVPTNKEMIRRDLTDLVYATEQGKFKAIIKDVKERQIKGQPVLIGTISIAKNEILAEMLERAGVKAQVLNAKNHEKEAQFIANAGKLHSVTIATNMAGRGVDIILGGGDGEQAKKVCELGGLHVIGTERHESRRIDNQLRGRSGRQGDPGSSQFYLSMEDDLMRIFGGERMKNIMATLKVPEDMPIENRIIARSIESAQKKVEQNNFDIRKHLVEYDDIINKHREAIYRRRREILKRAQDKKPCGDIILKMIAEEITAVVNFHTAGERPDEWNLKEIEETAKTIFSVPADFKNKLAELPRLKNGAEARQKIIEYIAELSRPAYNNLRFAINELIPSAEGEAAPDRFSEVEKQVLIRAIDTLWTEHIDAMDQMRRGIGLRGYGQRDPLIEYKKEAYRLFQQLNDLIRKQVVYSIFKVGDVSYFMAPSLSQLARQFSGPDKNAGSFSGFKKEDNTRPNIPPAGLSFAKTKAKNEEGEKIGRNDPCPCGAIKPDGTPIKYKYCHGK
ncbi:preprotein translocase subunit SecA [Candidatus Falkowbacteria bacterium CG10_big_fil_rev_8_21_14_0_10_43_10]|uniref:Protein translocase subunit SecA n=1 Tax=Candidatus Falkowbacteria bacterium CG10_big_fil_rev_8_21_14_0_10_43_10 TaxID=1974567 RepID=A0A2H0V2X2_9BACT|nr:MAG: preprotein translocase subunit SecA [Candidatus Falkowbacteria bacterium CG10_big_fil_rev_8_21_14_0_10_43_10]